MSDPLPAAAPAALPQLHLHGTPSWRPAGGGAPRVLERKHAALLTWLWLEGPTPRSRVAGLLWPDAPEDRARANLRQRLLRLRQDAGELVRDDGPVLRLAPGTLVAAADPPHAPLLQALEFDDCEAFARWLEGRREAERERRKREWLAEVREAMSTAGGQRLDDALYAADQLLQTDRESEEAYRVLMEVYYLRGDHAAALSAWDRCREMLRQLYGVLPSAATQQLGQTLLQAAQQAAAQSAALLAPAPAASQLPATVLRPPLLVGRDTAMQALVDGWHAGHLLVVTGVAGMGKSRLLADWQGSLAGAGPTAATAAAVARPGDAVLPYSSISRLLLAAIDRFAPALDSPHARQAARLLPRLAARTGVAAQPVQTEYERTQALLALARVLGDCARAGCVAFVLDDLQFADLASVAALSVLAQPPETDSPALRLAVGVRADEAGPDALALLAAWAAAARCTRVDLAPLSADDTLRLIASLGLPGDDASTWARHVWQQVGGTPAFLLESVKLLLTSGQAVSWARSGAGGTPPLPAGIEAIIRRRVDLLSARARHLAQLAAIAGSAYSVPLAAAALACTPLELGEPLRELELRQVFYGRQFVHDVIASVTLAAVPAPVAEFMHRFVAEHLVGHGGDAAHIATHWQACGEWQRAAAAFVQAAHAARDAALANEHAALLDRAAAALAHDAQAHDALFDVLAERVGVYESQGHEGLRPRLVQRLRDMARTEAQRLVALNHHCGWLTNLGQPVDEAESLAAITRAQAAHMPELAWQLARMLAWQWAMNNRADEALVLARVHEPWIEAEGGLRVQAAYRLARANIFAFGDRLPEAIVEGQRALQASVAAGDWPDALPAMSNLGVMHYWRGEHAQARAVLTQARELREQLYGSSGSGIKIDIHLGAVLYECGQAALAQAMLEGALAEMRRWPDNEYRRTECLLADNHLAQMFIALGRASEAAAVLARDATGVAERYYGRRLTLRLRWQRLFGTVDAALRDELRALATRLASPFNRALMELELARQAPPGNALAVFSDLHDSPVALQRPGLQLHAAVLATAAARAAGKAREATRWAQAARGLQARCAPFDMAPAEVRAVVGDGD